MIADKAQESAIYGKERLPHATLALKLSCKLCATPAALKQLQRRCQVGGFVMMERSDLARLAPMWMQATVALRMDPEAPRLAGEGASGRPGQHAACALTE